MSHKRHYEVPRPFDKGQLKPVNEAGSTPLYRIPTLNEALGNSVLELSDLRPRPTSVGNEATQYVGRLSTEWEVEITINESSYVVDMVLETEGQTAIKPSIK